MFFIRKLLPLIKNGYERCNRRWRMAEATTSSLKISPHCSNGSLEVTIAEAFSWTTADDRYLVAHKEGSMKDVAKHLKRTVASVYTRAYALRKNGQLVAAPTHKR